MSPKALLTEAMLNKYLAVIVLLFTCFMCTVASGLERGKSLAKYLDMGLIGTINAG